MRTLYLPAGMPLLSGPTTVKVPVPLSTFAGETVPGTGSSAGAKASMMAPSLGTVRGGPPGRILPGACRDPLLQPRMRQASRRTRGAHVLRMMETRGPGEAGREKGARQRREPPGGGSHVELGEP